MTSILYLTTAITPNDFDHINDLNNLKFNPSNQNFHNRLIYSFAKHHKVTVFSYRPKVFIKNKLKAAYDFHLSDTINYHYLPYLNCPLLRQLSVIHWGRFLYRKLSKNQLEKPLIIVDGLNQTLLTLAKLLANKYQLKMISVMTDNPFLLTNFKISNAQRLMKLNQTSHAYFCLTKGLNELVNQKNKPTLIWPGVAEVNPYQLKTNKPYFFFSGALYEQYGLFNLIKAFMNFKGAASLLIAGHGPHDLIEQMIKVDQRIVFLGLLNKQETLTYQSGSLANINPRPINETLNKYSIPSKVFEYMASSSLTISSNHPLFDHNFEQKLIILKSASIEEIETSLNFVFNIDKQKRLQQIKEAQTFILENYGVNATAQALLSFTNSIK